MPTLVWVIRPKSGTSGAAAVGGSAREAAATVPDPVVSATSTYLPRDPVQVAFPRVSSKRCADADGGKKKKRKIKSRAEAATSATKTVRDLPRGVQKKPSGKYESQIWWGDKVLHIGTFDTAEHASAAYMSVRKDLDDANLSAMHADEVDAIFIASAKEKVIEAAGGLATRDLPRGVRKTASGKFQTRIRWNGKQRTIGTFDTPEQASAAFMSVRKDIEDVNLSSLGTDQAEDMFYKAKKKALESFVGGLVSEKRDLPRGVRKRPNGRFRSDTYWGGKKRHIGTFDTPEQASATHMSVRKDLDDAKLRPCGPPDKAAAKIDVVFDVAKKKALEAVADST